MPRSPRSNVVAALLLILTALVTLCPAARAQDADGLDDPVPVDPAQLKATVAKSLAAYRNSKTDPAKRRQLAGELIGLGADGARAVVPELAKEVAARHKAYLAKFEKIGTGITDQRMKKPDSKKQIQEARDKVLGVSRDRNLTLERIKDFADPARRQLEALLSLTRDDVLAADKSLPADREELLAAVKMWRDGTDKLSADAKPAAAASAAMTAPTREAFEGELGTAETDLATLAALPDRKDRAIITANAGVAKKVDPAEARGVFVLNVLRARLGIGALPLDVKLCEASRDHSKDMQEMNFFDHISPLPGKEEPWDRAKLQGTTASAENIYQGGERGEDAIEGWWHSPGHHATMMAAGHRRVGMGKHEGFWTQMFGT